jgi:hypothetical protein
MPRTFPAVLALSLVLAGCETVRPPEDAADRAAPPAAAQQQGQQQAALPPAQPTPEQRALRVQILRQLQPCLQEAAPRLRGVGDVGTVAVYFGFAPDGTLVGARLPEASEPRLESDPAYRTVVETMIASVQQCSPLTDMPEEQHVDWGVFPLVFQPNEA